MVQKKNPIACFVLTIFLAVLLVNSASAPLEHRADPGEPSTPGQGEARRDVKDGAGSFEKENAPENALKKKHFPWLWVAAGAVAAGVIFYFVVIKKTEYKLTVAMTEGVQGDLQNGVSWYRKGKVISYSFSPKPGYHDPIVLLDGQQVSAQGSVKMNGHHYLQASADEIFYTLTVSLGTGVKGAPASGVYSHRMGQSVSYGYAADAGYDQLQVLLDGTPVGGQGTVTMDRDHLLAATVKPTSPTPPMPVDLSGQWSFVFTSTMGKGEVRATATFRQYENPPNSHGGFGHVQLVEDTYEWPWGRYWQYIQDRNRVTIELRPSGTMIYIFEGTLQNDRSMSGSYDYFMSDPYLFMDRGTWSATRN